MNKLGLISLFPLQFFGIARKLGTRNLCLAVLWPAVYYVFIVGAEGSLNPEGGAGIGGLYGVISFLKSSQFFSPGYLGVGLSFTRTYLPFIFFRIVRIVSLFRLSSLLCMCLCPIFQLCLRRIRLQGWFLRSLRIQPGGLRSLLQGAVCLLLSEALLGLPSFSVPRLFRGGGRSGAWLRHVFALRISPTPRFAAVHPAAPLSGKTPFFVVFVEGHGV